MSAVPLSRREEDFIVFLAPLINSIGGIAIDLFAPSIPAIGREFAVSASAMQNTITVTLVFYAVGQLFFGLLADGWGRRPSILLGLLLFMLGSVTAAFSTSIEMLMLARGLQGFAVGACQVVSRALLVDHVKGDRFRVAVVYLSLAFGLGPVISPYLGGLVQEWAGWRWNFGLYLGYAALVSAFVFFGLRESLAPKARKTVAQSLAGFGRILSHPTFLCAVVLLGASFATFLMWNLFGPFLIEERFGKTSSYFGSTALMVGCGYLAGTSINRVLVKRYPGSTLINAGLVLFGAGIALIASGGVALTLVTLLGGTVLIAFAQGFLFANALARTMTLFPGQAGSAASLQGCLMLTFGATASGIVSTVSIESNATVALVFGCLFAVATVAATVLAKTKGEGG